jgi:hypothetical protein
LESVSAFGAGGRISLNVSELAYGGFNSIRLGAVSALHPRNIGRDEGIAVDVGILSHLLGFCRRERLGLYWLRQGRTGHRSKAGAQSAKAAVRRVIFMNILELQITSV